MKLSLRILVLPLALAFASCAHIPDGKVRTYTGIELAALVAEIEAWLVAEGYKIESTDKRTASIVASSRAIDRKALGFLPWRQDRWLVVADAREDSISAIAQIIKPTKPAAPKNWSVHVYIQAQHRWVNEDSAPWESRERIPASDPAASDLLKALDERLNTAGAQRVSDARRLPL